MQDGDLSGRNAEELADELAKIRAKRGYLLPHHGLMAVSMPDLLEAYDALYTRITLTPRTLNRHQHEFVWMAVLIARHEALGTHHIPRYLEAGGTNRELANVVAIAALSKGVGCYQFVDERWIPHLPEFDAEASYRSAFEQAAGDVPLPLAHMAAAAVHLCTGNWGALAWQIKAAYAVQADEAGLAEALSLAMFPGSVPNFVNAAGVWRQLIVDGEVNATEVFGAWARLTGQGGFDEAAGVADPPKR